MWPQHKPRGRVLPQPLFNRRGSGREFAKKSVEAERKTQLVPNLGERDVFGKRVPVGAGLPGLPVAALAAKQMLCHYALMPLPLCFSVPLVKNGCQE